MPLPIAADAPTLIIRREAYERAGLARSALDAALGLTDEEFRVEGELVALGPLYDVEAMGQLVAQLEKLGLVYYDDFFELTGNWPPWLLVLAASGAGPGRSRPSQPQE
jgi:hypothetical protein